MKLSSDIEFDRYTQPICLPKEDYTQNEYMRFDMIGKGKLPEGVYPDDLQTLRVRVRKCSLEETEYQKACFASLDMGGVCAGE